MKKLLTADPKAVNLCRPLTIDKQVSPPLRKQSLTEVVCDEFGFNSNNHFGSGASWRNPKLAT